MQIHPAMRDLMPNIHSETSAKSQFEIVPDRHPDRGCSACALIQSRLAASFLLGKAITLHYVQETARKAVLDWDAGGHVSGGIVPDQLAAELVASKVPFGYDLAVSSAHDADSLEAMILLRSERTSRVLLITAPCNFSDDPADKTFDGKTFGIFIMN